MFPIHCVQPGAIHRKACAQGESAAPLHPTFALWMQPPRCASLGVTSPHSDTFFFAVTHQSFLLPPGLDSSLKGLQGIAAGEAHP